MIDLKAINAALIEEYNKKVYGGEMPAHNKESMRKKLEADDRFWLYFDRDHVPGKDDGEPPKGAEW